VARSRASDSNGAAWAPRVQRNGKPGFVMQADDVLLELIGAGLTGAEYQVFLAIHWRGARTYKSEPVEIATSEFCQKTKLGRSAVFAGLSGLTKRGMIVRNSEIGKPSTYSIAPVSQWDTTRPVQQMGTRPVEQMGYQPNPSTAPTQVAAPLKKPPIETNGDKNVERMGVSGDPQAVDAARGGTSSEENGAGVAERQATASHLRLRWTVRGAGDRLSSLHRNDDERPVLVTYDSTGSIEVRRYRDGRVERRPYGKTPGHLTRAK